MWQDLSNWLANTPFSLAIQTTTWAIPAIQTVHILGISVVLSSVLMMNMRLLNVAWRDTAPSVVAARFVKPVWIALVVLLLTGASLVIAEPGRSLTNPMFISKMSMLVLAIIATLIMQKNVLRVPASWDLLRPPAGARITAAVALLLWVSISVCGRLIAYLD